MTGVRRLVADRPELTAVVVAAVVGLTVRRPLTWAATHHGIDLLLAVLVLSTGTTIAPRSLRRLRSSWAPAAAALALGVTLLPALAWAVSRLVADGPLRHGVLTVGLAPTEVASVALTTVAGGEAALSAGLLIGSTVLAVAVAGPVLSLEVGGASVRPLGIVGHLALVVALPLALGLGLRAARPAVARAEGVATRVATVAVAALVALVAAQVHPTTRYLAVAAALGLFLAGSAAIGVLLGRGRSRPVAAALILSTSMRDFAIAAGVAAAAFGPAAAAPLGLYGIGVLVWGAALAGTLRRRQP